jgi:magnesium-transporting ATPase (P-type)
LWRAFGWLGLMEATLCFAGFISIFVLSGHARDIGLPFLAGLPLPPGWRLDLSLNQAVLLAATLYHAGVVMAQVGNALACRSDRARSSNLGWLSNRYLLLGIFIEIAAILCIIYIPFLAEMFKHAPLPAWMWAGLAFNTLVLYSMEWLRKLVLRGYNRFRGERHSLLTLQEVGE